MKHLSYGDKSLLVGDLVADLVVEYATALAQRATADSVTLNAVGPDGNDVVVTMLLDAGAAVIVESTNTQLPSPDNLEAEQYLLSKLELIRNPPAAGPVEVPDSPPLDFPG